MGFQTEGKVAIITGGASGLGFEYAKELLRNGLKVTMRRSEMMQLTYIMILGSHISRY